MNAFRRFVMIASIAAFGLVALATAALAQTAAPAPAADGSAEAATAIGAGSTTGLSVITDNIGVVLAVAGAWVALRIGKKMLGRIG